MPRVSSTYSTAERGGGSPVENYTVQRGSQVWRLTSTDVPQTVSGVDFTPTWLKRSAIEQKQDTPGIQFTLTVHLDSPLGQALLIKSTDPVTVTLQRTQSSGTPVNPVLLGEALSVKFSDDEAELTVATVEHRFKRQIPAVLVGRSCPWAVYSPSCGADPSAFAFSTTVDTVAWPVVTVVALSDTTDAFYSAGILVDANGKRYTIAKHDNTLDLTMWGDEPASGLEAGDAVTVYPGCDKTRTACINKFNNYDNYGGFPDLPTKDPGLIKLGTTFGPGAIS
jgi:uncharacterized phage protein (TIGR02218 family)